MASRGFGRHHSPNGVQKSPKDYASIAGPLQTAPEDGSYRVQYRSIQKGRRGRSAFIAVANLTLNALFVVWLLQPSHYPQLDGGLWMQFADVFATASVGLVMVLQTFNVLSLSLASIIARDPIPVTPDRKLRVAFVITFVPGKEPLEMLRATLVAACQMYQRFDVFEIWVLDEGDDYGVKTLCRELSVRHFSRKHMSKYNYSGNGPCKAKTKYGNINAWLFTYGTDYDIVAGVDPDHQPVQQFLERMLGWFRDARIAFVVGPQAYQNVGDSLVTLGSESQQFPFHSILQRAANFWGVPMLVGTSYAFRVEALLNIGGLQPSITEDLATSWALHVKRNPETGKKWRSVYSPDVLAHGEGPSSFSDFFSQQGRWCGGVYALLRSKYWREFLKLSPGKLLHYTLLVAFYPSMAISWVVGAVNALLFLTVNASGLNVPPSIWLALYVDTALFQFWLYASNRRHNVSPYEEEGSPGLLGMLMSAMALPIYTATLGRVMLGLKMKFVVTPKGEAASADGLFTTFRRHLIWAAFYVALLGALIYQGNPPVVMFWPVTALVICLTPIYLWKRETRMKAAALNDEAAALEAAEPAVAQPETISDWISTLSARDLEEVK